MLKPGGRFLCLEFSAVDVAGLDRLYDLFSFKVIPAIGDMVVGDGEPYRYLVESIRRFPNQARFAAMIEDAGFARVERAQPLRRDRRDAFRLEDLRADGRDDRRALPAGRRRLRAGARGRLRPGRPGRAAVGAARAAIRVARLIERRGVIGRRPSANG